ncbi:MAG: FAD-dependent oxidoreductase [Clostridia bacterium]|nr:FAD-dependent oxidoreductase [Clostridia bacterium]
MELYYDIVVLGGGPSGISASISARRLGAKVLLIEKNGVLGGMSTAGLLNVWCGDSYSKIFQKVIKNTTKKTDSGRRIFSPETLKYEYIKLIEEYGVDVLLHSFVCDVSVKNGRIESIKTASKSGYTSVFASNFIDATGDGDVANLCGIPFEMGREDGLTQPMTVEFMIGGVDSENALFKQARGNAYLQQKMQEYLSDGRISRPVGLIILIEALEPNTAFCNMTNVIGVDGTNVLDITKAEFEARKQIPQIIKFLRENVKGYENAYVITSACTVGARETRRLKGKYTLTYLDVQDGRFFDDWLVDGAKYCFGVHNPNGKVDAVIGKPVETGKRYTIPYGCFVSDKIENLAFAGRCISGDHYAHSSYRVMPICFAMGEGVGSCVAYAFANGLKVNSLTLSDVKKVQQLIEEEI